MSCMFLQSEDNSLILFFASDERFAVSKKLFTLVLKAAISEHPDAKTWELSNPTDRIAIDNVFIIVLDKIFYTICSLPLRTK